MALCIIGFLPRVGNTEKAPIRLHWRCRYYMYSPCAFSERWRRGEGHVYSIILQVITTVDKCVRQW